jgi:hypothetical protein
MSGGERAIPDRMKDNVILFPKTVDYYQFELTRMLETERYGEAVELLRFLKQCDSGDPRTSEEWDSLLSWLETTLPQSMHSSGEGSSYEEDEITEPELARRTMLMKGDTYYVDGLLKALSESGAVDKQLLALEQLAFMEHPEVTDRLLDWLQDTPHHPIIQFRTLQSLKRRGASGPVTLLRQGSRHQVEIEETPLSPEEYPGMLYDVVGRVQRVSDVKEPALSYFAEQTWGEFLSFVYGSPVYELLRGMEVADLDIWAAALHYELQESMGQNPDPLTVQEQYGIAGEASLSWKQACLVLKSFFQMALVP